MAVYFHSEEISIPKIPRNKLKKLTREILLSANYLTGEINYIFCNDNYLLEINKKYLNHHDFTDIITFPMPEDNKMSADIYISLERIKENSKLFNETFLRETCRVIIHGVLHLAGMKDKTAKEKSEMRKAEDFWIERL
ncbi:MAG: rRNA maturation RNase YbeY [Bacteroidales bacterium]|nr:rRNA maturation RNase YbeY [Bacteroidales bacterium]